MAPIEREDAKGAYNAAQFATTHWSVVLAAAQDPAPAATEALGQLCRAYWYPLYAFVRKKGYAPHDAQDLVQGFLARILAGKGLRGVEQGHGRFRFYLLSAMRHFLADEWDKANAEKRGGGVAIFPLDELRPEGRFSQDLADHSTPERLYDRAWAETVLDRVTARLREAYRSDGNASRFDLLEGYLLHDPERLTCAQIGAKLGLAEGTVKSELHRLKKRYRSLLRAEVAHTVASPVEIEGEIRCLMTTVGGSGPAGST